MDTDKLKSQIREALGAAGIPREISAQVDQIIDKVAGKKDDEPEARAQPVRQPDRSYNPAEKDEDEDDDDHARRAAPAKMAVKPARKTKAPTRKKK